MRRIDFTRNLLRLAALLTLVAVTRPPAAHAFAIATPPSFVCNVIGTTISSHTPLGLGAVTLPSIVLDTPDEAVALRVEIIGQSGTVYEYSLSPLLYTSSGVFQQYAYPFNLDWSPADPVVALGVVRSPYEPVYARLTFTATSNGVQGLTTTYLLAHDSVDGDEWCVDIGPSSI